MRTLVLVVAAILLSACLQERVVYVYVTPSPTTAQQQIASQPTPVATKLTTPQPPTPEPQRPLAADVRLVVKTRPISATFDNVAFTLDSVTMTSGGVSWQVSVWNQKERIVPNSNGNLVGFDFAMTGERAPYVLDERGTSYPAQLSVCCLAPRPGERKSVVIRTDTPNSDARTLTLRLKGSARDCYLGWCDEWIDFAPVTVNIK